MAGSKLQELKHLVHSLLECRNEEKLLIVALCDRGKESLTMLTQLGPELIRFLDDIAQNWCVEATKVCDGYLKPLKFPCHSTEVPKGAFNNMESSENTDAHGLDGDDRNSPNKSPVESTAFGYERAAYLNQDEQNTAYPKYQPLIKEPRQALDGGDCGSFSVLGLGSFPPTSQATGMEDVDLPVSGGHNERYVLVDGQQSQMIDRLKRECSERDNTIAELKQEIHQLRAQVSSPKPAGSNSELIVELQRLRLLEHQNADELAKLKRENEELTERAQVSSPKAAGSNSELVVQLQRLQLLEHQNADELARLKRENEELTKRLSKELSSKVSADESDLENVNIKNRPLNIATEYGGLCTNSWLDAKNELDQYCDKVGEKEKLRLLRKILMTSEEKAAQCHRRLLQSAENMLSEPLGHLENMERIDSGFMPQSLEPSAVCHKLPTALNNAIGDYLRCHADNLDLRYLVEEVRRSLLRKTVKGLGGESKAYSNKAVQQYIQECTQLAWKLQLQRPPMTLDDKTGLKEKWRKGEQELYYKSKCATGVEPIVQFYVHPALIHNTAILAKGVVYADANKKGESEA